MTQSQIGALFGSGTGDCVDLNCNIKSILWDIFSLKFFLSFLSAPTCSNLLHGNIHLPPPRLVSPIISLWTSPQTSPILVCSTRHDLPSSTGRPGWAPLPSCKKDTVCLHAVPNPWGGEGESSALDAALTGKSTRIHQQLFIRTREKRPWCLSIFRWTLLGLLSLLDCSLLPCTAVTNHSPEPCGRAPSTPSHSLIMISEIITQKRKQERDGGGMTVVGGEGEGFYRFLSPSAGS